MAHKTKRGSKSSSWSSSSSTITKCRNGVCTTKKTECKNGKCSRGKGKREALDAPMAHKTNRGSKSSSWSSSSSTITKCRNGVCTTKKTECKNGKCSRGKGKREALDAPMAHKTKRGSKS